MRRQPSIQGIGFFLFAVLLFVILITGAGEHYDAVKEYNDMEPNRGGVPRTHEKRQQQPIADSLHEIGTLDPSTTYDNQDSDRPPPESSVGQRNTPASQPYYQLSAVGVVLVVVDVLVL